jgi:hypothetical protein
LRQAERLDLLGEQADIRHEPGRPRYRLHVNVGNLTVRDLDLSKQILHVQNSDDVFGPPAPQWHARARRFKYGARHLLGCFVDAHGDHLGAVDHDVGNDELTEAEHILDEFRLAFLNIAVLGRFLHELLDLDIGQDFVRRRLLDAKHPHDGARRGIEEPAQRVQEKERRVEGIYDPLRYRHGFPDRQSLRYLLSEDDVQLGKYKEPD